MLSRKLTIAAAIAIALTACNNKTEMTVTEPDTASGGLEAIMTRSSVRSYTSAPVAADTVETLLRAAMAAPTACNQQPWHFVVVTKREKLNEIGDSLPGMKRMLDKAPLAIAVCGDETRFLEGDGRDFWVQDCSAATENMLVAANAMGLGAVWCGIYPIAERVKALQKALEVPSNIIPLCIVPIGHPDSAPDIKDKWDESKITHFE